MDYIISADQCPSVVKFHYIPSEVVAGEVMYGLNKLLNGGFFGIFEAFGDLFGVGMAGNCSRWIFRTPPCESTSPAKASTAKPYSWNPSENKHCAAVFGPDLGWGASVAKTKNS